MVTEVQRAVSPQLLLLAAIAACGWIGCANNLPAAPPEPVGLEGIIVEVGQEILIINRSDQLLQVWVKEDLESDCGTIFVVNAETVIRVRQADGSVERGTLEDLAEGDQVQVCGACQPE